MKSHKLTDRQRRIEFFMRWGGGVVGRNAINAAALADGEIAAENAGAVVEWRDELDPDYSFLDQEGFESEKYDQWQDERGRVQRSLKAHEVYCALLVDQSGAVLSALGNIFDPSREYMRVVAAELACEALEALTNCVVEF